MRSGPETLPGRPLDWRFGIEKRAAPNGCGFFVFSGQVDWPVAFVMAAGALIGGALGGKLAGRIKPAVLRRVVVAVSVVVAIFYFVRQGA